MQLKVTKLTDFLNEALPLSLAKKVIKIPRNKEVNNILNKAFSKYGKDRVYIDVSGEKLEIIQNSLSKSLSSYKPINDFFMSNDIKIIDFVNNVAKEPNQKNFTKITKILSKNNRPDLLKFYENDSARQSLQKLGMSSYKIVISKSKYDIAGMSTDRSWKSCMRLDTSPEMIKKHMGMRGSNAGVNARFVKEDIKEGTIIAYFIDGKDTNINKPLGRVLIKPFISSETKERVWVPENACYGDVSTYKNIKTIFLDFIKEWLRDNLNSISVTSKSGEFHKNPKLYNDDSYDTVTYEDGEVTKTKTGIPLDYVYSNPNISIFTGSDSDDINEFSGNQAMYVYEWEFDAVKIRKDTEDYPEVMNPQAFVSRLEQSLNTHDFLDSYIGEISEEGTSSELAEEFQQEHLYELILQHWFYSLYDSGEEIETSRKILFFMKDVVKHGLLDDYFSKEEDWKEEYLEIVNFCKSNPSVEEFNKFRMYNKMSVYRFLDSFVLHYPGNYTYRSSNQLDFDIIRQFDDFQKYLDIAKSDYTGLERFFKSCSFYVDFTNKAELGYYDDEEEKEMYALAESYPGRFGVKFNITSIQGGVIQLEFDY